MKTRILLFSFLLLVWIFSCGKEDANTELGGDTNIPLTKVDSVSNVYLNYNGTYLGSTTMKVVSNNNGEVTYNVKMDLKTFPNDLKLKALEYLPKVQSYYNVPNLKITPDQQIEFDFKLKITSEGYMAVSYTHLDVYKRQDMTRQEDIDLMKEISDEVFLLVKKYKGSWSGEHGDGRNRGHRLRDYFGEEVYQCLKDVKNIFDPAHIMNPGIIIAVSYTHLDVYKRQK